MWDVSKANKTINRNESLGVSRSGRKRNVDVRRGMYIYKYITEKTEENHYKTLWLYCGYVSRMLTEEMERIVRGDFSAYNTFICPPKTTPASLRGSIVVGLPH